jgi:glycosyltransferase involved in cell wall biosynthesis
MLTQVSTIIPVFNRASTIGQAVDTVLAQDLPSGWTARVIVVDDGSSDDVGGALRRFGERVTLLRHPRNAGAAAARNTGIAAVDGGYVAFLDSDDTWLPGKLAAQIVFMRDSRFVASCTAYRLARRGLPDISSPRYRTGALALADLVWGCFVSPGSTLMCTRSVFDEIGLLDTTLRRFEDWDWLLRYAHKHALGFLAEPLAHIEPSHYQDVTRVLAALAIMRARHMPRLAGGEQRRFAAALDTELAAAHYRRGDVLAVIPALLKSLLRVPIGNAALSAVLHNRFARG